MPVYEFRCETCGRDLEIFARLSDHGTEVCPFCGSTALIRAFRTAPAIHTVGCPSGSFRRIDDLNRLEKETNKKFGERNRDEIASAKWEVLEDKTVERGEEETRHMGIAPGSGFKPVSSSRVA